MIALQFVQYLFHESTLRLMETKFYHFRPELKNLEIEKDVTKFLNENLILRTLLEEFDYAILLV